MNPIRVPKENFQGRVASVPNILYAADVPSPVVVALQTAEAEMLECLLEHFKSMLPKPPGKEDFSFVTKFEFYPSGRLSGCLKVDLQATLNECNNIIIVFVDDPTRGKEWYTLPL